MTDDNPPIPADWTRITVHLGGSMHQMQLPSDKLYQWTEMLENELGLRDFRGTEAGAVLARELARQAARHRIRDEATEFGSVWGVCVTALWMFFHPACPELRRQHREQLSKLIEKDGRAYILATCSKYSHQKWLFDINPAHLAMYDEVICPLPTAPADATLN
jgi:hypothetical protein